MGEQIAGLAHRLREEGDAQSARLAGLTPTQWTLPIYTDGVAWTAHDVLAHLVAAERGHQRLIADVARGGPGAPPGFDIDAYNNSTVAALSGRSVADLLADAAAVRAQTIALVEGLSDEDLGRRGQHPALGANTALADFIRIVTMHAKMHLRDLQRALAPNAA